MSLVLKQFRKKRFSTKSSHATCHLFSGRASNLYVIIGVF